MNQTCKEKFAQKFGACIKKSVRITFSNVNTPIRTKYAPHSVVKILNNVSLFIGVDMAHFPQRAVINSLCYLRILRYYYMSHNI